MFTLKYVNIHQGCRHLKNLKEETNYPLGHGLDKDFFAPNITISAIVGENGSGKSSLLDMMFRILNNLGFSLFKNVKRSAADPMTYIEDIYADLIFDVDGCECAIMCRGGFVAIDFGELKYKFTHVIIETERDSYWRNQFKDFPEWKGKGNALRAITQSFFYTIATNYSMQSFIASDYAHESTFTYDLEKGDPNNKGDYVFAHRGSWLNNLFHKNDGYLHPIVLNPYRDNGWINMTNEEHLTVSRLMAILIEEDHENPFMDGYELNSLNYRINPRTLQEKFYDIDNHKKLYPNDREVDEHNKYKLANEQEWSYSGDKDLDDFKYYALKEGTYVNTILEALHLPVNKGMNRLQLYIREYIVYKVLSVAEKYPSFAAWKDLLGDHNLTFYEVRPPSKSEALRKAKKLAYAVKNDKTHIGLKLRQAIKFAKAAKNLDDSWLNRTITYQEYAQAINVPAKGLTISERMEFLPPSIFHSQIYLNKLDREKAVVGEMIKLNHLSSGERQFLYMMSTLVYHAINLKTIAADSNRVQYHKLNLVMDEVEICFHPELQRQFINKMIGVLTRMKLNEHFDINILLTTHSPFVLSDIPAANLLCMEKGVPKKGDEVLQQTFCANVYDLLNNHFFMKQFIGDFAAKKLDKIVERIKKANLSMQEYRLLERDIELIGDEFISSGLKELLAEHKPNQLEVLVDKESQLLAELDNVRKRINDLQE